MITNLISLASDVGASDIHIRPDKKPLFRIRGVLQEQTHLCAVPLTEINGFIEHYALQPSFVSTICVDNIRTRVTLTFAHSGITLALRLLSNCTRTFEELHLPQILDNICMKSQGLFLVAGATGAGKSTTASAIIQKALTLRNMHLITLENPIEYIYESTTSQITQQELGTHFSSFAMASQKALYQDPDFIYFGEINDTETVQTALTLAETGHFVLATVHARGAVEAFSRIIDLFSTDRQDFVRSQLLTTLIGVCWQTLVPCSEDLFPFCEVMQMVPSISALYKQNKPETSIREEIEHVPNCHSRIGSAIDLLTRGASLETLQNYVTPSELCIIKTRINRKGIL